MLNTVALVGLAAVALANPLPQAVTTPVAPSAPPPSGCQTSRDDDFTITVQNVSTTSTKRSLLKRQDVLTITLSDSVLTDQDGRTGYIASNFQFQFDGPPQAGAIYTSGFSVCANNSLALGGSAIFYQCLSGEFYNLYDRNWAPQCNPIYIIAQSGGSAPPASQATDGQPQVTSAVSQITDGQPQAPTGGAPPVTQITDGQPQAPTGQAPVTQISDGQPQAPTGGAPVTQISDGQPQAPTGGAPVTQISDGQPQAPTGGAPVTQISDGQPQAPTGGAPVTQISDGQPQAPLTTAAPVTQISDGQPQAPPVTQISDGQPQAPIASSSVAVVTQISDGQIQAPTSPSIVQQQPSQTTSPAAFTGGAVVAHDVGNGGVYAVAVGLAGAFALL